MGVNDSAADRDEVAAAAGGATPVSAADLAEREARWRSVLDDQTELICRFGPDLILTLVNRAYAQQYDCEPQALIGQSMLDLFPPEARDWARRHVASLEPGRAYTHENEVHFPDGTVAWYQWTDQAVTDEDGRIIEFQAVGRDISERRRMEEALRESEERFRGAFDHAPIGMALTDGEGCFKLVNPAMCAFLGRDEAGLRKLRLSDVLIAEADVGADTALGSTAEGVERRFRRADDSEMWGLLTLSEITEGQGSMLAQIVDLTARKKAEQQLAHQALHDPLTGLPNRVLLLDRLTHALQRAGRQDGLVAVLFCDLDMFKVVNDSLGHEAGDTLLVAVSERLRSCLRAEDTLARFGGDEFVFVTEELRGQADAEALARRIAAVLEAPFQVAATEVVCQASIGIAFPITPDADAGTLIRDADAAMYRAKERGRGRFEICDASLRAVAASRLGVQNSLRRALEKGEFVLHYQPMFGVSGLSLVGAEALLRWNDPVHGLVGPDRFLETAEDSGLIVPIGAWVLETACRQLAEWTSQRLVPPGFQMWVNLSSRELALPDLAATVSATVSRCGVDPGDVVLEITESALMADAATTLETLAALTRLGVRLAVDDFGTGYSSLAYLKRFPLDALKIDRSFIDGLGRDIEDAAIVTAVTHLGAALDLTVVGEGVETDLQLQELASIGCGLVQGYHFSRPVSAEVFAERWTFVAG